MTNDSRPYLPRKPRHMASDATQFEVELERRHGEPKVLQGRLLDFSRNGFRIQTDVTIEDGEPVVLRMELENIQQRVGLKAVCRWVKFDDAEEHWVGFLFEEEAPLEVIGELMLLGVLSHD